MFRFSIAIEAPPERVFEELSHVERHPLWANPKAKMHMEQVQGAGPGADAVYRSSGIFSKAAVTADVTVKDYEPSRVFSIHSAQHQEGKKDQWYDNSFRLTLQGNGTLLEKTTDGSIGPIIKVIARPAITKDAMTSLENLKRLVETSA
ncbi:MAG: SRPBCC family protein [Actinomycetota bacterium]